MGWDHRRYGISRKGQSSERVKKLQGILKFRVSSRVFYYQKHMPI